LSRCEERKDGLIQEYHAKIAKRKKAGKPYQRNNKPKFPDESIEMALNMNVDVCVASQFIRGIAYLPHGSGRLPRRCLVFTNCPETQQKALAMGAVMVGGESLVESIASETVTLPKGRKIDMCLATSDMMNHIQANPAVHKILRRNRILPKEKKETICSTNEELLEDLYNTISNRYVWYQTERRGIIHLRVGKASMGIERLTENIASVMKGIYAKRPAEHGIWKAKKRRGRRPILATKKRIFVLKAYIRSAHGKTLRIHTLTLNPESQYFLQEMPTLEESEAEVLRLKKLALGNDQEKSDTTKEEEQIQTDSSSAICLSSST
jgi:large subunit ribosomal protein L1